MKGYAISGGGRPQSADVVADDVEEYVSAKAGVPLVVARGESEALACHLDDLKKICTDAGIVFTIHPTG